MVVKKIFIGFALTTLLVGCGSGTSDGVKFETKPSLGEALFSDVNLSFNRSQSCATCHNPDQGFVDDRTNDASIAGQASAASLGDNGLSIGDRNAPTAAYAAFSPEFHEGTRERVVRQRQNGVGAYEGFLGGQFLDGRESNLAGQAGGPPTNPLEMGMPDKASVVDRLKENSDYVAAFELIYGADIFNDTENAYEAMSESIGEFEKTAEFSPFDSKYDLSLTGDYEYSIISKASIGKTRFFSSDLTCASCHQLEADSSKTELFTSFEFHNIGVPENTALRAINGVDQLDTGLLQNPLVVDDSEKGKFKVPTLRNVAVTAPYMHNGVFNELETVIEFYEHAKLRANDMPDSSVNPETQLAWQVPEIDENIETELLGANHITLDESEVQALVCFLMTLTDARYEHLLDQEKVESCGI